MQNQKCRRTFMTLFAVVGAPAEPKYSTRSTTTGPSGWTTIPVVQCHTARMTRLREISIVLRAERGDKFYLFY